MTHSDIRLQQLTTWIHQQWPSATIEVASADASFRRYFRVHHHGETYIAMDAPPAQEDCTPFVDVTQRLRAAGVHAPEILRQDLAQGFLLLEDFGSTPYLNALNAKTADALYTDALHELIAIQQANPADLPNYDVDFLLQEMHYMPEWFLQRHLNIQSSSAEQQTLNGVLQHIVGKVIEQPQVFVHRDYHSRNLMVTPQQNPGVIDYQDAMNGPITYDLVSLLRDCYIRWEAAEVERWALQFKQLATQANLLRADLSDATFIQWFDYTGLQRHIKVLGIFARLNHRDGKANYLNDLPLTLHYTLQIAQKYEETRPLVELFQRWQVPERIGTVSAASCAR